MSEDDHDYDDFRFYDPVAKEWGYRRFCLNSKHKHLQCPLEGELFRIDKKKEKV